MKKIIILFCGFLFCVNISNAQKLYDVNWLMGFDTGASLEKEGVWLKFTEKTVNSYYFQNNMQTISGNTSISDKNGNLIAYTNGCYIANSLHQVMINGDNLNPSKQSNDYCKYGISTLCSLIFLPHPIDSSQYYLFQLGSSYSEDLIYFQNALLYSIVNTDKGIDNSYVSEKNSNVFKDTLTDGMLTAVRHADGKSWWVIVPKKASNIYHTVLLNGEGLFNKEPQNIGYKFSIYDYSGQAVFSPDGTKYARADPHNVLEIMNFDRCVGRFFNPKTIKLPDTLFCGLAFSPNSRFLYLSVGYTKLYQYDTWANDIEKSAELIGEFDGYKSLNFALFKSCQLAPNNKIYMHPQLTDVIHVINNPDAKGKACDFQQHGLKLPTYTESIPLFPNYRLGKSNIDCTTSDKDLKRESDIFSINIIPNPSSGLFNLCIDTNENLDNLLWIFYNELGEIVDKKTLTSKGNNIYFDYSSYPKGVYYYTLFIENKPCKTGKIIIID